MTFDLQLWVTLTFDLDNIFCNFDKWPLKYFLFQVFNINGFLNIDNWSSVMDHSWSTYAFEAYFFLEWVTALPGILLIKSYNLNPPISDL